VAFITIVFCLPASNPVTSQTLNYTPVAMGIVLVLIFGTWFLWAHKWFTGPIRQIELEKAGIDPTDPAAVAELEAREANHPEVAELEDKKVVNELDGKTVSELPEKTG
jgi:hypothetical protein